MKVVLSLPGWWGVMVALACVAAAVVLLRAAVQIATGRLVVRDQGITALMLAVVALRLLLEAGWVVMVLVG